MKKIRIASLLILLATMLCFSALAADDIVWDFSIDNELDGWVKTNCTAEVKDGYLFGQATTNQVGSYDPYVTQSTSAPASDYRYIVMSMKHENERALTNSTSIYFATDTKGVSESTRVTNPPYEGKTTDGKYIVQVFDMSTNENWTGTITKIRIDMLGSGGNYSIDYIKLTSTLPEKVDIITAGSSAAGEVGKETKTEYFTKTLSYKIGMFSDVAVSDWFSSGVSGAYELGLMNGMSDTVFSPKGNVTVAQAVAIGARMHNIYHSNNADFSAKNGESWTAPYIKYATDNGFFTSISFDDYNRNIKRSEMAVLFASVLPSDYYNPVNHVGFVPDVALDASYRESVLLLYNAGIMMGSDDYGTFYPDREITRAEVAAIIDRVALPAERITGKLLAKSENTEDFKPDTTGVYLIDNATLLNGGVLQDGWDYYYAGAKPNYTALTTNVLDDINENAGTFLRRYITKQTSGKIRLFYTYKINYDANGVYFRLCDDNGKKVYDVFTENGMYYIENGGKKSNLGVKATTGDGHSNVVDVDLDKKTCSLYIDGGYCGSYGFDEDISEIAYFEAGTAKAASPCLIMQSCFMTKNYLFTDDFRSADLSLFNVETKNDYAYSGSLDVAAKKGTPLTAKTDFAKASGKICFEVMFYADKMPDGLTFSLDSDENKAFSLTTKGTKLTTVTGKTFDKVVASNLWNLLRIEADTKTGKAVVKLNGKTLGEADFDKKCDFVNGVTISAVTDADVNLKFDEAYATLLFDYADYCPKPVKAESKDYILGINVCSLWREGYHKGWGCISPYEEIEPVLGFYDEGIPEVADWEIKFMAEHGIDYQLLCWYGNGQNGPVKLGRGGAGAELHEGYFNAKYSDEVKFAIMWENSSNSCTLEQFKENVVPYWVEYYLTDPRYMTVDNKPIITVWTVGALTAKMGVDGTKQALEYLRETCIGLGYDGCILMCCDNHSTRPDQFKILSSVGFDATYAYHWNEGGVKYYTQTNRMTNYVKYNADPEVPTEEKISLVPTVSVGFNSIGWKGRRTGLIDTEGYQKVCDFIKDTMLPLNADKDYKKMVMISTWNEYGEGTYMMPSKSLGFTYLDEVAKAFTDKSTHTDSVPTEAQKARLGYLYPSYRHLLSPMYNEDISEYPQNVAYSIKLSNDNLDKYEIYSCDNKKINEQGNFTATSTGNSIIFNKEALDLDISNISYVRVTMKAKSPSVADQLSAYFFFATDDYPNIEEATRTGISLPNGGDMETYYVNIGANSRWHGKLKTLRFDPASKGAEFEIDSIELLYDDAKIPVYVNEKQLKTYGVPQTDNNHLLIPAVPAYGTFTALSAYYNWDKSEQKLTVEGNDHTVVMTVGSDKALVDGKEQAMYTTLTMFDGVPLLPYDLLSRYLGYEYKRTDDRIDITTPFKK